MDNCQFIKTKKTIKKYLKMRNRGMIEGKYPLSKILGTRIVLDFRGLGF